MSASDLDMLAASLRALVVACTATIAIELAAAIAFFRIRSTDDMRIIVLAQLATNPIVQLCSMLVGWSPSDPFPSASWAAIIILEVAAVIVEAYIYRYAQTFEKPVLASCALNAASFCIGCAVALVF